MAPTCASTTPHVHTSTQAKHYIEILILWCIRCGTIFHSLKAKTPTLITNLFALYAFTYSPPHPLPHQTNHSHDLSSAFTSQVSSILREIELSERKLHRIERGLAGYPSPLDPTSPKLPAELRAFLSRRPLPLGRDSRSGITELASSVSHSCSPGLLSTFMSYSPHSPCPASSPPLSSCDPLPCRRCLSRSSPRTSPPSPAPGTSRTTKGKNDFSVEDVLSLAPSGTVRVAFDFDAPAADFAAAMARHNVTVVTSSSLPLHADGLLFLTMGSAQRFPFYDNIFDVVRVVKGMEEAAAEAMEFLMFDVDRVLRPKGLLWMDNYCCADDGRKRAVTRLVERFGYRKLKWVVGERAEAGKTARVYLSAVLQKPTRG